MATVAMARWGIARQVLSLSSLFGVECLPADEATPLYTAFSNGAAELAARHPDTFLTPEEAAGLKPALVAADRLGSHPFVHPGPVAPRPERIVRGSPGHQVWQRQIVPEDPRRGCWRRSSRARSLGAFNAYSDSAVQVANLGGAVPFLVECMHEVARREVGPLPSDRLHRGRPCVDTAFFGPRAIVQVVMCFGAERVLLGSDCPISDTGQAVQAVNAARLDVSAKALVLGGNARRLFG